MANALIWFRRDLRLSDNPAWQAAIDAGLAPIPVYIHAPSEDAPWQPGAASRAWLHRSLLALDAGLRARGSRLIVRRGDSLGQLEALVDASGAEAIFWNRLYEPAAVARDARVSDHFRRRGLRADGGHGALLVEPASIRSGSGTPYRVFTPFWKQASLQLPATRPLLPPDALPSPPPGLASLPVAELGLAPRRPWDAGFWEHWQPGEAGAQEMLDIFVDGAANGYQAQRDLPDRTGTSRLSPHLHFGEVSPRQVLHRLRSESWPAKVEPDIAHFVRELGWREFSHHLLYHFPESSERNFNAKFDRFRWLEPEPATLAAWQYGRTGVPIVDAGMRELRATGWMHNRVRMVVASFLCKNLRYHWRHGADWFWNSLVDADLANNTMGWQWCAGTGADAAPYHRIFNPVTQAERFDGRGTYIRRWVPELAALPAPALFAPWLHAALAKQLAPDYPANPIVDLKVSRDAALAALTDAR